MHSLANLVNLCLEADCPLCQRTAAPVLCQDCQRQLQRLKLPQPEQFWVPPLPVFAWGTYGGVLKRTLAALKYDHQPQLAQPLGDWLAQAWLRSTLATRKPLIVVPIPMHRDKQKQRGFNQAERMARAFCQRTQLPLQPQALVRCRATEAQFGLSAADRIDNLSDAFALEPTFRPPVGSAVLLLDDIYTTGATARSAAQVFRQHRISVYGIVAVAKTGSSDPT